VLLRRIWSIYVKECEHNQKYTNNWTLGPHPDRLETCRSPHALASVPNLIAVSQTVRKAGLRTSCLSRSLKVIDSDTDRTATYDLLSVESSGDSVESSLLFRLEYDIRGIESNLTYAYKYDA